VTNNGFHINRGILDWHWSLVYIYTIIVFYPLVFSQFCFIWDWYCLVDACRLLLAACVAVLVCFGASIKRTEIKLSGASLSVRMSSGGDNVAPWTVQRETASLIASGAQQRSKRALCMVRWPMVAGLAWPLRRCPATLPAAAGAQVRVSHCIRVETNAFRSLTACRN